MSNLSPNGPLRIGIGGPVGAGKTTLTARLAAGLKDHFSIGVITNDIYTQEDAEALMRMQILPLDRIIGVETGGCPHTAIREDASINLAAIAQMQARHADLQIVLIESGGDNLSATFSPELADLTIYVIDTASGEDIPRKGGPALTRSDILVINKTDLAPYVGARLDDGGGCHRARAPGPFVMAQLPRAGGVEQIVDLILRWAVCPQVCKNRLKAYRLSKKPKNCLRAFGATAPRQSHHGPVIIVSCPYEPQIFRPHGRPPSARPVLTDRAVFTGLCRDPTRHDAGHHHQFPAFLGKNPPLGDCAAPVGLCGNLFALHHGGRA